MGKMTPITPISIPTAARTLGVSIVAEAGSGKSVLLGSSFAFWDFAYHSVPVIMFDNAGMMTHTFFACVENQKPEVREKLKARIRYVELGNPDYAYGLPFYHDQAGTNDYYSMSQRPLDIFVKIDPDTALPKVAQTLAHRGWRYSSEQIQFRNTALLDLTPSEAELLARMKSKTRYNVRLAGRKGGLCSWLR